MGDFQEASMIHEGQSEEAIVAFQEGVISDMWNKLVEMFKKLWYNNRCCYGFNVLRRCQEWQNAAFAVRVLFSAILFLTPIVRPTEPGSPISARSRFPRTEPLKPSASVRVVCAP